MEKKTGYSAGPFSVDEIGFIQIAEGKVLAAAARGLGLSGEWVGFQKARDIHGLN